MPKLGKMEHALLDRSKTGFRSACASPVAAFYFSSFTTAHPGAVRTDAS